MTLPIVLILAGCSVCVSQISVVDALRNLVFDTYQRMAPRERGSENPVAIIDIDDESLQKIGQWPWPRSTLAKISDRLAQGGAVAVGYDILFSEPDRLSPERLVEQLPPSPQRTEIAELVSAAGLKNDVLFAKSLAQLPSVLGFVTTAKAGGRRTRLASLSAETTRASGCRISWARSFPSRSWRHPVRPSAASYSYRTAIS